MWRNRERDSGRCPGPDALRHFRSHFGSGSWNIASVVLHSSGVGPKVLIVVQLGRATSGSMSTAVLDLERPAVAPQPPPAAPTVDGPRRTSRATHVAHLRALVTKNAILKKRQWSTSCIPWFLLGVWIAVFLLLKGANSECSKEQCDQVSRAGWGLWNSYTDVISQSYPIFFILREMYERDTTLALAYTRDEDRHKLERMRDFISEHWHPAMNLSTGALPSFKDLTRILKAVDLEQYLESHRASCYGAVVFDKIVGNGALGGSGCTHRLSRSVHSSQRGKKKHALCFSSHLWLHY